MAAPIPAATSSGFGAASKQPRASHQFGLRLNGLLDDSPRAGVWPDSVQVIGGQLSMRLPTG